MKIGVVVQAAAAVSAPGGLRGRNAGLDVARSLAILMVFGSHASTFGTGVAGPAATALGFMAHAGVELFFSLSGFLIGGILIRTAREGMGARSVGRFLARRWFRTLPLYYVALAGAAYWFAIPGGPSWWLLQTFYPAAPRALPVSWSLVMEEYFYFFFPLLMVVAGLVVRGAVALVASVAVGLIVVCTALRFANVEGLLHYGAGEVHEHPFLRMDCAAYGVLGACIVAQWRERVAAALAGLHWVVLAGCGVVAVLFGVLFVFIVHTPVEGLVQAGYLRWGAAYGALQYSVLDAVFAVAVVAFAFAPMRLPRWLGWAVGWVSVLSYSIYLTHLAVLAVLDGVAPGGLAARLGVMAAGTVAASVVTYWLVERPFLWVRDRVA